MLGFEFLTVGFHGAVWIMKKYCMHQWKKNRWTARVFHTNPYNLAKNKRRRRKRRRMRRRFLYFPFYSLNKSNVFRLTEHCWDVNRGPTNCRYWYYSDLTRLRGKCSHLFCVSPAVRGSQSTFCAANFHVTLLSQDTHPSAKPLVFCHEG